MQNRTATVSQFLAMHPCAMAVLLYLATVCRRTASHSKPTSPERRCLTSPSRMQLQPSRTAMAVWDSDGPICPMPDTAIMDARIKTGRSGTGTRCDLGDVPIPQRAACMRALRIKRVPLPRQTTPCRGYRPERRKQPETIYPAQVNTPIPGANRRWSAKGPCRQRSGALNHPLPTVHPWAHGLAENAHRS